MRLPEIRPAAAGGTRCLALLEQSADGVLLLDPATERILWANGRLLRWLGYTREEITSLTEGDLIATEGSAVSLERVQRVLREGMIPVQLCCYRCADGSLREMEASRSLVSRGVGRLIMVNLRDAAEIRRSYVSSNDTLTGLPNRSLLLERLDGEIARAKRWGRLVAVMVLNLDRFRFVNDALGNRLGDLILCAAAGRLLGVVRGSDTVGRLAGDEFAVVLGGLRDVRAADIVARKIVGAFEEHFQAGGQEVFLTAGIGITVYPRDGDDGETLLRYAGTAMRHAKERGRSNHWFFTPDLGAAVSESIRLDNALRKAMEREEFLLHYQPEVDIVSRRIVGLEALLRWRSPEFGLVGPERVVRLAEESGLILTLGDWVLERACEQHAVWLREGLPGGRMAVNLSARQFHQPKFEEKVAGILARTGLDAGFLELELTESLLMQDAAGAVRTLRELRNMGVRIAVDDFGTGYSSLSYLKRFPLDKLKIDQTFIRDLGVDPDAGTITEAVVGLAHTLRLRTVAEGVENEAQLEFLRALGCDEAQGYFFGRPVPAADTERILQAEAGRLKTGDRWLERDA